MSTVSTQVFAYIIMFHDGGRKFITEDQYNFILQASSDPTKKSINTPQLKYVAFSSIARIPSIEEYYEDFPEQRAEKPWDQFSELYPEYTKAGSDQIRRPTPRARELMLQGFRQYHREKGLTEPEIDLKVKQFFDKQVSHRLDTTAAETDLQNRKQRGEFNRTVDNTH